MRSVSDERNECRHVACLSTGDGRAMLSILGPWEVSKRRFVADILSCTQTVEDMRNELRITMGLQDSHSPHWFACDCPGLRQNVGDRKRRASVIARLHAQLVTCASVQEEWDSSIQFPLMSGLDSF